MLTDRAGFVDANSRRLASLHDLRRTGASLAAMAGTPDALIAHQLGHAEGRRITSEHYIGRPDAAMQVRFAAAFSAGEAAQYIGPLNH